MSTSWEALLPYLSNVGVAGIWLFSYLRGWIITEREADHTEAERDQWHDLYLKECEAHERTREALRLASSRGDATVDALQLMTGVINAVRVQAGHEDLREAPRSRRERDQSSDGGNREVGAGS